MKTCNRRFFCSGVAALAASLSLYGCGGGGLGGNGGSDNTFVFQTNGSTINRFPLVVTSSSGTALQANGRYSLSGTLTSGSGENRRQVQFTVVSNQPIQAGQRFPLQPDSTPDPGQGYLTYSEGEPAARVWTAESGQLQGELRIIALSNTTYFIRVLNASLQQTVPAGTPDTGTPVMNGTASFTAAIAME